MKVVYDVVDFVIHLACMKKICSTEYDALESINTNIKNVKNFICFPYKFSNNYA